MWTLAQDVEAAPVGFIIEAMQFGVGQCCSNQQDRVGVGRPRFKNLELVHDEVFAQAGNLRDRRSCFQVRKATLKKLLFGEDGEAACTTVLERFREELHIELRPDEPLGRRSLLKFGDDRGARTRPLAQSCRKAARRVCSRERFE